MNKMMTLGMLLAAASLLAGCQKEEKNVAQVAQTVPAPTAQKDLGESNMIALSELQKGEVIRGKEFSDGSAMSDVKTINNSAKAEAARGQASSPVLSYSDVVNCESGSCKIDNLQNANSASEHLKGMLRKFPLLNHTHTAKADEMETFEEQKLMAGEAGNYNEIKIPEAALRSSHEDLKLPGSGHSQLPAADKAQKDLWPGGIPLEAEIDPAVTGF